MNSTMQYVMRFSGGPLDGEFMPASGRVSSSQPVLVYTPHRMHYVVTEAVRVLDTTFLRMVPERTVRRDGKEPDWRMN